MPNVWDKVIGSEEYNENLVRVKKIADAKNYILNPDQARVEKVVGLMTLNSQEFGKYYCPCKQSKPLDPNKDVLCPCSQIDEEITRDGNCFCKLFFKKT